MICSGSIILLDSANSIVAKIFKIIMKFCLQLFLAISFLISFSFRAQAQPVITVDTIIGANCNASADGAINISVAGTPGFTFSWSNGATTEDISGLFSNSYVVTVTDGLGFSTVSSVLTVNAPPVLAVNTDSITQIACAGDTNGEVFISVAGGTLPYTYLWDNGETTQDVTGLGAGPVNLTVTDGNGCESSSKSIFLDSVPAISLVLDTISNISCNLTNDGFINVTASGGVGNFSYLWSSGQTTDDISALAANLYTVTATDSNGCSAISGPHTISQPGLLALTLDSIDHLLCNGENIGAVFITTSGGTAPFTYFWSNNATTEDITGLLGDTYFVTVTDTNGCQATSGPHVVNEPPAIVVTVDTIIKQLCANVPSGAVDLSVSGGTANYTYLWGNGETTQDVSGLYSGVNDVTVTDANGCTASAKSIFLDSIVPVTITVDSVVDVSCNGANVGGVFISVSGGTGPAYIYNWSNGATTQDISGLAGNTYSVTVTDSNSCVMFSGPHTVNEPALIQLTFDSIQPVDCNSNANGGVFVTVTGGTANYSFNWSNGMSTEDITGLDGGAYTLTLTDANGCVDSTGPHLVNEPDSLLLFLDSIQHVDCNANGNGAVFVSVTGGTTNYSFNWSNTATTEDITGLNGGGYSLTVTDANGCTVTDTTYIVNEPAVLALLLDSIVNVSCNAFGDGAVFVSDSGGTTAYTYLWSNAATTQDITGLSGSSYTLTLTDANACTVTSGPHIVNEPAGMTITLDTIIHVSCNAADDGQIRITASGGAPNYSFLWSNAATADDISGLQAGLYTVTVTDDNGCTVSAGPYIVEEDSAIVVNLDSVINATCNGLSDGELMVDVVGGLAPYSFVWSNGATTQDITGLAANTYSLTVTDSASCQLTAGTFTVTEPPVLTVIVDSVISVSCNGGTDGSAFISVNGGTSPFTYLWSNAASTEDISALSQGVYFLTVTDSNSCVINGNVTVTEPSVLSVIGSGNPVSCDGSSDGIARVFASGGDSTYSYLWDVPAGSQTTDFAVGLLPGNYCVTVTDGNSCSDSLCVTVLPTTHTFAASGDTTICEGDSTQIFATAGFTYSWSPAIRLNDSTLQNPIAFPVVTTNYIVSADTLSGVNIIYNGDFESGSTGFSSDYVVGTGGTFGQLSAAGTYAINTNASNTHNNFAPCTDHTSGTGNFLIVNGATTAGQNVWCQTVNVVPNTDYQLSTWINSVVTSNPAILQFQINGISLGTSFNASSTTCLWNQFFEVWNSGTDTVAVICITNQNIQQGGNDFGLDDIEFMAVCNLTDSVLVTVNPTPQILPATSAPVCVGDSFSISANGGGTYSWTGPNGFTSSGQNPVFPNSVSADSGLYAVVVTTTLGCIDSATLNVEVNQNPTLTVSPQNISCFGLDDGTATANPLGGGGGYTFLWSDNQTVQSASGLAPNVYQVTLSDVNSCTATDIVTITEPAEITTTVASVDLPCNGDASGTATVSVVNSGPFSYVWSVNASGQTTAAVTGLAAGFYSVSSTDTSGCSVVDTVTVSEPPAFGNINMIDTKVSCLVDSTGSLSISLSGGVPNYTFLWSDGQSGTTAAGLAAGSYSVTVTDNNNCTLSVTDTVYNSFQPQVSPFVGQSPIIDSTVNWGDVINIDAGNDQTADTVTYFWEETTSFGLLNIDDVTAPSTTVNPQPDSNAVYSVLLTATSADGCVDTASLIIRVNIDDLLGMPDAFTPNNDGFNDFFRPAGLDDQFILEFKIFNRWGQLVFDGRDTSSNWDGTYLGAEQPSEVYIYILRYQIPGQAEQILKGEMTLIR